MKTYYVSFQIFDRYLKVKVEANSAEEAAAYVRQKIDIKKIEQEPYPEPKKPTSNIDEIFRNFGIDIENFFNGKK